MNIERMTANDLKDVLILAKQLGYPNTLEDFASRFSIIQSDPNFALYVARNSSAKVIGYVQINREAHTLLSGPRAEVVALVVDEKERSKGVGAALLNVAEAWAKENRLPLIRVRSNIKRADAHRFYQKKN